MNPELEIQLNLWRSVFIVLSTKIFTHWTPLCCKFFHFHKYNVIIPVFAVFFIAIKLLFRYLHEIIFNSRDFEYLNRAEVFHKVDYLSVNL